MDRFGGKLLSKKLLDNQRIAINDWYDSICLIISCNLRCFDKKTLRPTCTQAEGFILGVGAKMFTIAGPVIVYGVSASVVYGLIYWITTLI